MLCGEWGQNTLILWGIGLSSCRELAWRSLQILRGITEALLVEICPLNQGPSSSELRSIRESLRAGFIAKSPLRGCAPAPPFASKGQRGTWVGFRWPLHFGHYWDSTGDKLWHFQYRISLLNFGSISRYQILEFMKSDLISIFLLLPTLSKIKIEPLIYCLWHHHDILNEIPKHAQEKLDLSINYLISDVNISSKHLSDSHSGKVGRHNL